MRTVSKAFFALCLFWNVGAVARQPYLPDPELTPGDVFDVTVTDICTPGYSKAVRSVPKYLRDQAFRNYGIEPHRRRDYQLDHLTLPDRGSNSPHVAFRTASVRTLVSIRNPSAWVCALKLGNAFLRATLHPGQSGIDSFTGDGAARWARAACMFSI